MNSFFRALGAAIFLLILFTTKAAFSVQLIGVYTAACKRELGTIIHVKDRSIDFLNLEGKLVKIKPHQIIYLSYYPIDHLPTSGRVDASEVDRLRVYTKVGSELKVLTEGWPVGFTKDKVAFLTTKGNEVLVSKENIFKIDQLENTKKFVFRSKQKASDYNFIHPYVFRHCEEGKQVKKIDVYPQQLISSTIMIKKELDDLELGYSTVKRYIREQRFYAEPEKYNNRTALGMWVAMGSRYGASSKRPANLTPVLTDTYSSDIFDYQHIFITGSAPMEYAAHGESQTQAYYAFKASYFHLSSFLDPNLILVGKRYKWQRGDFEKPDGKFNPSGMLEMGLDFGRWSFQFYLTDIWEIGLYDGTDLVLASGSVPRLGLSYTGIDYDLDVSAGGSTLDGDNQVKVEASMLRANLKAKKYKDWKFRYSLIMRNINGNSSVSGFKHESKAIENYVYGDYLFKEKYRWSSYLGYEKNDSSYTGGKTAQASYLKIGTGLSIDF